MEIYTDGTKNDILEKSTETSARRQPTYSTENKIEIINQQDAPSLSVSCILKTNKFEHANDKLVDRLKTQKINATKDVGKIFLALVT